MTETYIPLIKVLSGLVKDKVPFEITISLSPTLICMMEDPILIRRYRNHLEKLSNWRKKRGNGHVTADISVACLLISSEFSGNTQCV
jgi:predicted glycosyl hydrolase (DUF1957 family)